MNKPYNFGFVRFQFKNHASRAVQNLNGSCIDGSIISVSEAKYGTGTRDNKIDLLDHKLVKTMEEQGPSTHLKKPSANYASFKNALLGVHQKVDNGNLNEANPMKKTINEKSMRKVEVVPSTEQQDLLNRSIVAESVKPIKFGRVVQGFKGLAKEFGRSECRDFGPLRCIISFESVELRDKVLQIRFMPEFFHKITPYWGISWKTSRRIWLEDRSSFIVARILIDYFQWELIHEWISVECEDAVVQVYVKEIGADFLSFQVHPEEDPKSSCSCSAFDLPGTMEVENIPSETNKQEDSMSTKCIIDDRCSKEIIKETQLKLYEEPFEGAIHDNHSTSEKSLPPGFEGFKQRKIEEDNEEKEETDDIEEDAEESFNCDDEVDENIEEAKITSQVCEDTGIFINEDEDVILEKMTKKKKNNAKHRLKKMQLQGGLKLSKRLLMPGAS
ncbi:hypothetical protein PIB30_015671 [Stylosanthes scabra]|uniref:RRM domain-containing protein n=1 Tax=Stylosanthes scabra TaxID=79078 RepID=A0ABU6U622_9FABA|nr:hypothetical protein [Stylosanthes scabra]